MQSIGNMIKAIIFDLGGVVINFNNTPYYKYLSKEGGLSLKTIRHVIEDVTLPDFEKGKITLQQFEKNTAIKLGMKQNRIRWLEFYKETVMFNYDVIELITTLHKEYITGYLSNVDISRYLYTIKIMNMDLFDFKFASCYIKLRKPDIKIYKKVIKELKLPSKEIIFIDDREENVNSAIKAGINGIHFKDRRTLDIELSKLGL